MSVCFTGLCIMIPCMQSEQPGIYMSLPMMPQVVRSGSESQLYRGFGCDTCHRPARATGNQLCTPQGLPAPPCLLYDPVPLPPVVTTRLLSLSACLAKLKSCYSSFQQLLHSCLHICLRTSSCSGYYTAARLCIGLGACKL